MRICIGGLVGGLFLGNFGGNFYNTISADVSNTTVSNIDVSNPGARFSNGYDIVVSPLNRPVRYEDAGFNVTVLTPRDWERSGAGSLREALNDVPFLNVVSTSGVTSIFFRGSGSIHTSVLLNGVSLSDPSSVNSAANIDVIPLHSIEKIEIISGGNSVYNGSSSVAGVINIVTKQAPNLVSQSGSISAASDRAASTPVVSTPIVSTHYEQSDAANSGSVFASGASDRVSVSVGASFDYDDRISSQPGVGDENAQFRELYLMNSGVKLGSAQLSLGATTGKSDISYDSFGSTYFTTYDQNTQSAEIAIGVTPWWHSRFSYGHMSIQRDGASNDYAGESTEFRLTNFFSLPFGLAVDTQLSQAHVEANATGSFDNFDASQSQNGFLLAVESFNPIVNVRLAKRFHTIDLASYESDSISLFKTFDSMGVMLKGTYSANFRAPSLYEVLYTIQPSPLDPERSFSRDVSIEKNWQTGLVGGNVGVSYFETDVTERIAYDDTPAGWENDGYVNDSGVYGVKGYTLSASLSRFFLDHMGVSYTGYTMRRNDAEAHKTALRVPEFKLAASLGHRVGQVEAGASYVVTGEQSDFGDTTVGAFSVLNGRVAFHVNDNAVLYVRAENLFNFQYENPAGYGAPSRTVFLGGRWGF